MLVVLTGGARSGKSRAAVEIATNTAMPVVFVATAEPLDDDMVSRIELHRAERPSNWETIEATRDLPSAMSSVDCNVTVVIDCLTLWIATLISDDPLKPTDAVIDETATLISDDPLKLADAITDEVGLLLEQLKARDGVTVVVTNEVGSGVVPATALGRAYRDLLGLVNQTLVTAADMAYLVVAGRLLLLRQAASALTLRANMPSTGG
ncbi:MAG: bifunctional adenosylcobinamide kinase/adenosylcobinamide-phosphate guanylyltransferase [Acidimicrobiaceae bacterium]|nr:bifunctional adenosylcobinamide kinase/adenosylcobinamide-phosphate guanylyltransferase [Acidimicrobiaceae bacterium]